MSGDTVISKIGYIKWHALEWLQSNLEVNCGALALRSFSSLWARANVWNDPTRPKSVDLPQTCTCTPYHVSYRYHWSLKRSFAHELDWLCFFKCKRHFTFVDTNSGWKLFVKVCKVAIPRVSRCETWCFLFCLVWSLRRVWVYRWSSR